MRGKDDVEQTPLEAALEAARDLPESLQEILAAELLERIDSLSKSHLNPEQIAEVKRRIADATYASDAEVRDFFEGFGISP